MPADDLRKRNDAVVQMGWVQMRRDQIRQGLSPLYIPQYDALCALLKDTFWAPYSGLRTFKEQSKIYEQGRKTKGAIVTHADAGDSPHNWGCSTDWAEFRPEFVGQEMWNKANWKQYADAVRACGLVWGGDWKRLVDKPHNEIKISLTWKRIGEIYRKENEPLARLALEKGVIT